MTGSAPGERAGAERSAIARLREAALPLGLLLVLGLALRLIIAYVILPGSGLGFDVGSFNSWAADLAAHGPWGIYDRGFFLDYTPGYLYVLWLLGGVAGVLGGPGAVPGDLLKVPAMLADLGLAVGVFLLVADLAGSRRQALVAAAIVLAVPVTWIDSAVWSQVDSVGTLVLVLAVWRLGRGDDVGGTVLTTLAAIIKPQFGILIPLAAVLIISRDFVPRERRWWVDDPILWAIRIVGLVCIGVSIVPGLGAIGPFIGLGATVAAVVLWLRDRELGFGLGRLAGIALVGLGAAQAICLPFGITVLRLATNIVQTGNGYPYITVNAYNPWALVTSGDQGLALNGTWIPDVTTIEHGQGLMILGIPAVLVGTAFLLAAIAVLAAVLWRRPDRRTLVLTLAVLSIAFYVLPTRVHERYMFPFFAFGAVLAAASPRWGGVYAVLATGVTMNLLGVLGIYRNSTTGLDAFFDAFGGAGTSLTDAIRSTAGVSFAAILSVAGLAGAAFLLARRGPEPEEEAWEPGPMPGVLPAPRGGASPEGAAGMDAPAGLAARPGQWLRRARFDRSAFLVGEGGGRLDRLDLWLLVVLVVASLVLRTFRLSEPAGMHFDEVYHARTAMEFLQDWRYGEPHDVYEYTHPHLAKYAIAAGLVAFGNDKVVATSQVGAPVRDAVIEPRWDDPPVTDDAGAVVNAARRGGERLYLATGSAVQVYDLVTRTRIATLDAPGAVSVALDLAGRRLLVGTGTGEILAVTTDATLAELRDAKASDPPRSLKPFVSAAGPIAHLWATGDGTTLVAALDDGTLAAFDASGATGVATASTQMPGVVDMVDAGPLPALVATPAAVDDPAAEAKRLAEILGGTATDYEALLRASAPEVTLTSQVDADKAALDAAIADGSLAGLAFKSVPLVEVADGQGVAFVDPATLKVAARVGVTGGASGLAVVDTADPKAIYAATGPGLTVIPLPTDARPGPTTSKTVWLPNTATRVMTDPSSGLVHALGRTQDGSGWTVYVVEPRGNSVFADAQLPFEPAAWALDASPDHPSEDRQELLTFAADGGSAAVDVGQHSFAWRMPGVLAGALMAGFLFLLARILFRRRSIAVLVGIFGVLDGMFFVQSRIAMNDVYLGVFLVAGLALFAAIWTGAWRGRLAFWAGLPAVGVLLGLALASKWVAVYAIGALGVLILIRSALGRVVVILGLAAATGVLGWMAVAVPAEGAVSGGDLVFVMLMMTITILAAVMAVLHPIAWTPDEVRIAVGLPTAAGAVLVLLAIPLGRTATWIPLALVCFAVAVVAVAGFWIGGRLGVGPLAAPPAADDPAALLPPPSDPPDGWLRPGSMFGAPILWAAASLLLVPIVVYVVSYIPWAFATTGSPAIFPAGTPIIGNWPPGHGGQTLWELTKSMYDYHNDLRATHAASSPWWAWPLDLKPVWFYQGQYAGDTSGAIYDGGNVVLWWLSIPAMAFAAFQAFRRRSNALGLVAVMIACMWLSWARIDRATFEYHYYGTLPFVFLALAYFVAEIWHGPSARIWLLARAGAAIALLGPVILWVIRGPLCAISGVELVNKGSQACTSAAQVSITPSAQVLGLIVVLLLGGGLVVGQMLRLDRLAREGATADETRSDRMVVVVTAIVSVVGLALAFLVLPREPLFAGTTVPGEVMALILLVILGPLAWIAMTARSPRRFVAGFVAGAAVAFVGFYPNWAALPLPDAVFNYYQGVTPTWLYAFQFSVNQNPPFAIKILDAPALILVCVTLGAAVLMAWVAGTWRIALAERAADDGALAVEG